MEVVDIALFFGLITWEWFLFYAHFGIGNCLLIFSSDDTKLSFWDWFRVICLDLVDVDSDFLEAEVYCCRAKVASIWDEGGWSFWLPFRFFFLNNRLVLRSKSYASFRFFSLFSLSYMAISAAIYASATLARFSISFCFSISYFVGPFTFWTVLTLAVVASATIS